MCLCYHYLLKKVNIWYIVMLQDKELVVCLCKMCDVRCYFCTRQANRRSSSSLTPIPPCLSLFATPSARFVVNSIVFSYSFFSNALSRLLRETHSLLRGLRPLLRNSCRSRSGLLSLSRPN